VANPDTWQKTAEARKRKKDGHRYRRKRKPPPYPSKKPEKKNLKRLLPYASDAQNRKTIIHHHLPHTEALRSSEGSQKDNLTRFTLVKQSKKKAHRQWFFSTGKKDQTQNPTILGTQNQTSSMATRSYDKT
jgi:hypothetical protein